MDIRPDVTAPSRTRFDAGVAFFAVWGVAGLYLDGWAHTHQRPETFFTPWHGVLYSGVALGVVFAIVEGLRSGRTPADHLQRIGFGVFAVGAVGDLIWHTIFGIEVNLGALLSPTHLLLLTGAVLMVTGPVRSAIATRPTGRALVPAIVALTVATLIAAFFVRFLSPFRLTGLGADQIAQAFAIASVYVTNTILVVAVLLAVRAWTTPLGTFTFMFAAGAFGVQADFDMRAPLLILAAAVAGYLVDVVVRVSGPSRVRNAAIAAPIALWSLWILAEAVTAGVHWPAEIAPGLVVMTALEGWGLYALVSAIRPEQTERTSPASA